MNTPPDGLPREPQTGALRVALFCGPVLERGMVRFARMLDQHPEIELVVGLCQSDGLGRGARLRDLFRRRGVVAVALLALELLGSAFRWLTRPGDELRQRRDESWLRAWLHVGPDIHASECLELLRSSEADLGVIYGGPILKPALFELPRFGTLGIHHGSLPAYRGKKTTFWALFNDEPTAGVTIQKVNAGVDTGLLVRYGAVPARGRSYARVERELEELGLDLYLDAVVAVKRGEARARPIEGEKRRLYRDPRPIDFLRYARRRWFAHRAGRPSAPPRFLLLTESYHPMTGGGENQARSLVASLVASGLSAGVITRRWDSRLCSVSWVDGVPVWRVAPSGAGHLKKWGLALTALPAILSLRHGRPVLVVNGFRVLGIPAMIAARLCGLRVLLKGDSPGEMSGSFFDPGLRRFGLDHRSFPIRVAIAMRNALLRRADLFVAISSALAKELEEHGIDPARIQLIPNGVDVSIFRPAAVDEKLRLREQLGLDRDARLAIYAGRLVSYKGLALLVEAWRTIRDRHPDTRLLLLGSGGADIHNCEAMLRSYVDEHGLSGHVLFPGEVENVADHLRASDLFVFPSQEEAFGLAVVEAMACGLPVVSTRTGGLADFVAEENGAIPVESGKLDSLIGGVERVLSDATLAGDLARRGPDTVRARFSLEAVRDRYREWILLSSDATGEAP